MIYMLTNDDMNIEIQAVKRAMRKNKSLRMYKKYMVILRHLQGCLNNEIAEMEHLCANAVGTYINNYKKIWS